MIYSQVVCGTKTDRADDGVNRLDDGCRLIRNKKEILINDKGGAWNYRRMEIHNSNQILEAKFSRLHAEND